MPGRVFVGSIVSTVGSSTISGVNEARLFKQEEFTAKFGRPFDPTKDYVGIMNGDATAEYTYLDSAGYFVSGAIWAGMRGGDVGAEVRLNYLVVLGD